ncbi:MAG: threonine--tRNA ligase [Christensenellales bacterium]|jgi:threonyl-tRNA synthetase
MLELTLKNGEKMPVEEGTPAVDVARKISEGLARNAVAAKLDGRLVDLNAPLQTDGELLFVTTRDEDGLHVLRHTASHIMAQAVLRLFPEAKLAIGPAIDNGFYYDFDVERPFTPDDLQAIEAEMKKIIKENYKVERFELPRQEALAFVAEENQPFKVELIEELPEDSIISFYRQGEFTDLCAGPHMPSTGKLKAFKLMSVAGAYWRGDEHNKMLQRIYAAAFDHKADLDAYVKRMEEAKKRDHRKLGRELDLFTIMEEGPGFPFFFPKGMVVRNQLENFWREIHAASGYQEIKTPIILSRSLWETSGHWDHYQGNMYTTVIDGEDYAIKPMNCPGGMLVYKRRIYSYRDLPVRMGEMGLVHRHELSGALHGLMRVRNFTQDDAHIFMTPEQIKDEIIGVIRLTSRVYNIFGFKFHVELSTRPKDSMGSDQAWEMSTNALKEAMDELEMDYIINEGDGAFYGPKIDFHLEDSIGRTWQCGTIQLDMNMPERFDLTYVGPDGERHRPVMIHRVVYGSVERFIGILTEHFAGAFPLWLSPVQVKVMTITERSDERAREIESILSQAGIRVEADLRNEKIGFKIREAQVEKVPYMLVLGDKEVQSGQVAVRSRGDGDLGVMDLEAFTEKVQKEIRDKAL